MKLSKLVRKARRGTGQPEPSPLDHYLAEARSEVYLQWLVRMVGGWLDGQSGNLASFLYAASHLPPEGAVVEVGSFLGASTNALCYLLEKYGGQRPFFNCDPWQFVGTEEPIGGYFDASQPAWREYVRDLFFRSTRLFSASCLPHSFEATSDEFFSLWREGATLVDLFGRPTRLGGPIAFAYVDGDHSYEAARRDVENVREHLVPGGLLHLDDSADDSAFECRHVVPDLRALGFTVIWQDPNYLLRSPGGSAAP